MSDLSNNRPSTEPQQWFIDEVKNGLKALVALRLPGTPSADTIRFSRDVWVRVLCKTRVWDQHLDTDRIRTAFINLCVDRKEWPAPKNFLEALPKREDQTALPKPEYDKEKARENLEKIKAIVGSVSVSTRKESTE